MPPTKKVKRRRATPPEQDGSGPTTTRESHTVDGRQVGLSHLLNSDLRDLTQTEDRPKPLEARNLIIIGQNGEGKSSLVESDPNCFIFDADMSGAQNPNRKAVRFPDPKQHEYVSFRVFNQFVDDVVRVKKENPDLPIRFAVDRTESLLKLAMNHAEDVTGKQWSQLDGRQWYNHVYGWMLDAMWRLNKVGIGMTWLCSAVPTRAKVNGQDVVETGHSLPTGLQSRMQGEVEEIFYLYRRREEQSVKDKNGRKLGRTKSVYLRCLTPDMDDVDSSTLQAVLKNRLQGHLGEMVIDDGDFDSWSSTITPAYSDAIESWLDKASEAR